MADQARRCAVQDAAHGECAAAGHECFFLDEVSSATYGQILQLCALNTKRRSVAPVSAHHHLTDKFIVGGPVSEVAMTAKHQGLVDRFLQIPMR
ncbi:hypothetical protein AWB74_03387 [Caballeronia arvi]|uniref:Uncharacterized protein n=1 Tax=Caballeronia arvi TaxID=1777135 RepID=A0A158J453_9BURK|nr:hypothetical protein AWB74_03387 [Caballeronia arvi]